MKQIIGLKIQKLSIVGASLAMCLAIGACGKNPPSKKAPTITPINGSDPNGPVAPGVNSVVTLGNPSVCDTFTKIVAHIQSPAANDLTAKDATRFCLYEVAVGATDMNNVVLSDGLTIQKGLKLAFADVNYGDHSVTFSHAKAICESLSMDGGGWSLPTSSKVVEENSTSLETIITYLHNPNFPIELRFFGLSALLTEDKVTVGIPSTGITTEAMNMTDEALVCIKK